MVYQAVLLIVILHIHFIDCGLMIVINKSNNYFDPDMIKTAPTEPFSCMNGSGKMQCSFKSDYFSSHSVWMPQTAHPQISVGNNSSFPALLPYQTCKELTMTALQEKGTIMGVHKIGQGTFDNGLYLTDQGQKSLVEMALHLSRNTVTNQPDFQGVKQITLYVSLDLLTQGTLLIIWHCADLCLVQNMLLVSSNYRILLNSHSLSSRLRTITSQKSHSPLILFL